MKTLKFASLLLLLYLGALQTSAQDVIILNEIEYAQDVPPTLTLMVDFDKFESIGKLSVQNIRARENSHIRMTFQEVAYVVTYSDQTYSVSLVPVKKGTSAILLYEYLVEYEPAPENILYQSTIVSDIRAWVLGDMIEKYKTEFDSWN